MREFASLFACLVCVGSGRRVQTSVERLLVAPTTTVSLLEDSNRTGCVHEKSSASQQSLLELPRHAGEESYVARWSSSKTITLLFALTGGAFSLLAFCMSNRKEDLDLSRSFDESLSEGKEKPLLNSEAETNAADAPSSAHISSNLAKVVAFSVAGEIIAEVVICVSSTVDDLTAAILKKAGMKASTHIVSVRHKDVDLTGKQVLRDLGMKPLMHSSVIVTARKKKTLKISFQPVDAPVADDYLIDSGEKFCNHAGFMYGWSHDNTDGGRKRARLPDPVLDTFVIPDRSGKHGRDFHWKIELEPGEYEVKLGFSDPHPVYGRKDGNAGRLHGASFDVGRGTSRKELKRDLVVSGRELRLEGSYATGLSGPCYIHICGGSFDPEDENNEESLHPHS